MQPIDAATRVAKQLETAWNAGDGAAFAAPFTQDAAFVNIRGELHRGNSNIAAGHDHIFKTIYAGSKLTYEVIDASRLVDGVVVAQVRGTLTVPTGPLAGTNRSLATVTLVGDEEPRIAVFHNTLVA